MILLPEFRKAYALCVIFYLIFGRKSVGFLP